MKTGSRNIDNCNFLFFSMCAGHPTIVDATDPERSLVSTKLYLINLW